MKVTCAYYINTKRMTMVLDKLALREGVRLVPIRGTFVRSNQATRCVSQHCEYLVLPEEGAPMLLTNKEEYAKFDKQVMDYDISVGVRDNMYVQLLTLCMDKYGWSNNPFIMECAVKGMSVEASRDSDVMEFRFKSPQGDGLLDTNNIPLQLYRECKGIKSFRYTVHTDSCDKEVSVKRGQKEILREIAHYTNKALILQSFEDDKVVRELCIASTGCCERFRSKGRYHIAKVPFTKVIIDQFCSVFALDAPLDIILKHSSFTVVKD